MYYAEKKIKSGKMFEAEFYPCFPSGRRINGGTSKSQAEYNHKQSIKKFVRIVNANFDENSYFMSPTYSPEHAPLTKEGAERDCSSFIRRLRRLCKKRGCKLKYAYSIEEVVYQRGIHKGKSNWHFHIFVDAPAVTSKEVEKLWKLGVRVNCHNYQPERFGQTAAAGYTTKDPKGKRRFRCSKGLDKPDIKTSKPKHFSQRRIEKLLESCYDADFWQKKYPGYRFIKCEPFFNDYNKSWYFYIEMRRLPDKPTHYKERTG